MADWGKIIFNQQRGHFAIVGRWQGKRHYLSQYPTREGFIPCTTRDLIQRLKTSIDAAIDRKEFNPDVYKKPRSLQLEKYSVAWLKEIKPNVATGTWHGYEYDLRRYINPVLGHKYLPDIGHQDLKKVMAKMAHLSAKTKKNVMGCLHTMLMDAQRDGHLGQLPPWIQFKGKNEVVNPEIVYLTVEQQLKILEHIPEHHRPIYLFMMATGCRPSEARALRKDDIFDEYILFRNAFGYKGEIKPVKSKRTEPFPLYHELRYILNSTTKWPIQFVFINPNTRRHYGREINQIWNTACEAAKINRIKLYNAVRHSYACQLLNSGVEKAIVSKLLRHSDPRMIERYGKYEVASLEKAAGVVRRLR